MPLRSLFVAAVTAAALTATAAPALAAPPPNDNYLASTPLNAKGTTLAFQSTDSVDTTEATTQSDLFNPGPDGQPLGGAGPENTRCNGTVFGKTVWWDFHPKVDGGVEIKTSGFDNVITVYEWDDSTNPNDPNVAKITKTVQCQDASPGTAEDMVLLDEVKGGRAYTVQVGGVQGPGGLIAGGPLSFELDYFADTDGDGVLDAQPDHCRTTPGPDSSGGCPPGLNVSPLINFDKLPGVGIRIQSLSVGHLPKGARVTARCGGCPTARATAKHSSVTFRSLVGRIVKKGSKVQIQVTLGRTGHGKYRFGATGSLFTWPVIDGNIRPKITQCLHVKTNKIQKCR
jgi:hypothetical protein